jgi:hypothetical protein
LTYEGHAWERLVFHEVRRINPNIKCIGYQHAPIIKYQHASHRNLSPSYNPDIILTAGRIGEQQFKDSSKLKYVDIKCLGSAKSRSSKLNNDIHLQSCLVIPEGILSECLMLFEFSLLCAYEMPDQKFIWRLHPLLNFQELRYKSKIFNKLPDNILLSEKELDLDLQRCDSVLYRGSTAVMNAINAGLKPIYYKQNNEMSIDPIYQHNAGKSVVGSYTEFKNSINKPFAKEERLALINFSQNLYSPLDYSVFFDLIQATRV